MTKQEEIVKKYEHTTFQNEVIVYREDALKAMDEYAASLQGQQGDDDAKKIQEEKELFAMSFAVWALFDPQAQVYIAAKCTTYELLEKYKSRPFIDTFNPSNQ